MRFAPPEAQCLVYTSKEGVLSAMAHDLELQVARFSLEIDEGGVALAATFDAASLEVVTALEAGAAIGALSPSDKQTIARNIVDEVLHARRYPEIRYRATSVEGSGDLREVRGSLTLHGITRELNCQARRTGGRWRVEVPLHQPDFAVRPYRAMLGTLRVKPDVMVRLSIPAAPALGPERAA